MTHHRSLRGVTESVCGRGYKLCTRPISEQERRLNMNSNVPLDPRFRAEMVEEAVKSNSNMFGLQSQDFVKSVRKSNES